MNESESTEFILKELGEDEILCQLAEEAAELAKAALKLRRAKSGKNPTPKTEDEARADLVEEFADVINAASFVITEDDVAKTDEIILRKRERWMKRIEEARKAKAAE